MTPKTLPINEIQEIFDMKQLKKIAAAVLIAAMLGLLLPQLGVNAEALKRGSRGDLVRQLQTRLRSWGYYSGTVDGVYGAKTESAVRAFQKRNGLTADGIVGQKTAAALGLNLPSSTGGGSAASSNGNLYLLARLVHGEARGEPYKGKVAVAAVVLNRVRSASFPNTIAGVIYQSGAFDAVSDGIRATDVCIITILRPQQADGCSHGPFCCASGLMLFAEKLRNFEQEKVKR